MKVYLVNQTQEVDNLVDKTIYVCSTCERAQEYCRKLNKEYGCGCEFDENWDLVEVLDYDDCHYYDWESMEIDEPLA